MNPRLRVVLCLCLVVLGASARAFGQPNAKLIPLKVKPQLEPADESVLNDSIDEQFKKLADPSSEIQRKARESLVDESHNLIGETSADYLAKYSARVNTDALALLSANKNIRVRLNAAIVVARIADISKTSRLEDTAIALLDANESEAIQMWGLRACRGVLPSLIAQKRADKMFAKIAAVIKQRNASGSIAAEAYDALTPPPPDNANNVAGIAAAQAVAAGPLFDLMEMRIAVYKKGIPEDPIIDFDPFNYLMQSVVWDVALNVKQRFRAAQAWTDLMVLSAHRADDPQNKAMRDQLLEGMRRGSQSVWVTANLMGEQAMAEAAKDLSKKLVNPVGPVLPMLTPVVDLLKKSPQYDKIQIPAKPSE